MQSGNWTISLTQYSEYILYNTQNDFILFVVAVGDFHFEFYYFYSGVINLYRSF